MAPRTSGPLPARQSTSVAVSVTPRSLRRARNGNGMDHTRSAAVRAASGGMAWCRPRGRTMSWVWTRTSSSGSRTVVPGGWRLEPSRRR